MRLVWLIVVLLCGAGVAAAQCRPEGRAQFTAGLEALSGGDLATAAAAFEALVHAQPDCVEARNNLAVVLVERGRLDEAVEQLQRAVKLRPDYQRARFNLERIEGLRHTRQAPAVQVAAPPASAAPVPAVQAPTPQPPAQAVHLEIAPAAPPVTPAEKGVGTTPEVPAAIAALGSEGATACAIESAQQRVCLYRRRGSAITTEACFPIVAVQVGAWPGWLTASDTTAERIRLVDETGRRRLKVIPERGSGGNDVVRVSQASFDTLRANVVPWKTSWVAAGAQDATDGRQPEVLAAVRDALERWRQAWERKQADDYFDQYSAAFVPQTEPDAAHWRARKQRVFEQSGAISVQLEPPSIVIVGQPRMVITSFEQSYSSGVTHSRDQKVLRWQEDRGRWRISAETVLTEYPSEKGGE